MTQFYDTDTLVCKLPGELQLTLTSGYGQAVSSTVYAKGLDGNSIELVRFDGNTANYDLGGSNTYKYGRIIIHSTIHDSQDIMEGKETLDIQLTIEMECHGEKVDTVFLKKTKGKGAIVNCIYEVTII